MTEGKKDLAFYQAHPERYKIGANGSIYDFEIGRFCDLFPELNPNAITPETSRAMLERKRQIGQMAQLRGLARAAGMELDNATLEEIARGAGDAIENMTAHFYKVFMESSNVRGLAEAFRGLTAPLLGDPDEQKTPPGEVGKIADLTELVRELRQAIGPQAIDGRVIDADPTS